MVVVILYLVLAYWAVGKVLYEDKILIGTAMGIFSKKMAIALLIGWLLIPIAMLKALFWH